jgi:hypothetical protein
MLGKKHSDITKQKIRAKLKGKRWKPIRLCPICGKDGVRAGRKYCSEKCYGISERGKISPMKGKKFGIEFGIKISNSKKGKHPHNYGKPNYKGRGENCHLWRGGITNINAKIRTSLEYKEWSRSILARDNYTCQNCGQRGGKIEAHHKKSFAKYPHLRFEISNGITLCLLCHKQTDTYLKNLH